MAKSIIEELQLLVISSRHERLRIIMCQALRFGVAGVMAVAIHYGVYIVLRQWTTDTIAYAVGYGVSFVCNFLLTCVFTFHKRANIYRGIGFCIAHGINFCLQIGLFKLFLWLGVEADIAPMPVFCIAVPVNFLLVRYVFKK